MRVIGIGIDVVEVERITSAIERYGPLFLNRLFTARERQYCDSHAQPPLHYAARFAAKEAVAKALGTGIGEHVGWLDLEIVNDTHGAPKLVLSGAAASFAKNLGISEIQISLTHARQYAAANALAIANSENAP
jgi:holo-[acyl-carrier protein] synthase